MLYVPDINQNLLSVEQLIEKGNKVVFEDKCCLIKDVDDQNMFKVKMEGKSFVLKPSGEEQIVFVSKESVTN